MSEFRTIMDVKSCTVGDVPLLCPHIIAGSFSVVTLVKRYLENRVVGTSGSILFGQNSCSAAKPQSSSTPSKFRSCNKNFFSTNEPFA